MKIIHTRDDLIDLIARNAPTKACEVVIRTKGASVLGGFTVAGHSGWIVEVKGTHRTWLIGLWVDEINRRYFVTYPDSVPWDKQINQSFTGRRYASRDSQAAQDRGSAAVRAGKVGREDHAADGVQLDERRAERRIPPIPRYRQSPRSS